METGGTLTARLREFPGRPASTADANTLGRGACTPGPASGHHTDQARSHRSPNSASYPRCRHHAQPTVHIGGIVRSAEYRVPITRREQDRQVAEFPAECVLMDHPAPGPSVRADIPFGSALRTRPAL